MFAMKKGCERGFGVWLSGGTPVDGACENQVVRRYGVVVHEDAENGFWAEVPALPGCYSQGETAEELLENVREAIAGVVAVMQEEGKSPETGIRILNVAV